jgi:hypothetical protein
MSGATFIVWLECLFVTVRAPEPGDVFACAAEPRFLRQDLRADRANLKGVVYDHATSLAYTTHAKERTDLTNRKNGQTTQAMTCISPAG